MFYYYKDIEYIYLQYPLNRNNTNDKKYADYNQVSS